MTEESSPGRVRRLDPAARDAAFASLVGRVLTGVHPFAGDPFERRDDLEVVGEELSAWVDDFPRRLRRASGGTTAVALRTQRGDDDRIEVLDGWEVDLAADGWWQTASSIDLTVNGLDFVLSDDTASWAILVLPDAQLVGADAGFCDNYFEGDAGKREAVDIFLATVGEPEGYEEFQRLATYLRFTVDGQRVEA